MIDTPCHACKERHVGCHANCQDYILWCKQNEALKKKIRKAEQLERWRSKKP